MSVVETSRIIQGDSVKVMRGFADGCIDLVVASPPYDNIRDYKGFKFDCLPVAAELFRVIKPGGVCVWVVQDSKVNCSMTLSSMRQAIVFNDAGWNVHDVMIYLKNSCAFPRSNQYQPVWEYMFAFSKGLPKTFNPIRKKNIQIKKLDHRTTFRQKDGSMKQCKLIATPSDSIEHNVFPYSVGYNCTTKDAFAFQHPAMFPEGLARDQIFSWSNRGDVVLDPFCGGGTTLKMAEETGRKWIGIDVSPEYCDLSRQRIKVAQPELAIQ